MCFDGHKIFDREAGMISTSSFKTRISLRLIGVVVCLVCCFNNPTMAQPKTGGNVVPPTESESTHKKSDVSRGEPNTSIKESVFNRTRLLKEWRCVSQQPMMEMDAKEVFLKNQTAKGEGRLTFSWTDGTKLHLFLESTSRWRLDAGKLCDVPTSMHFTQMSGEPNPHVDRLISAMQSQADKRMTSNLETCKRIKSLTDTELVLTIPSPQGEVETRCTPAGETKNDK